MSGENSKNYTQQGGDTTVIGGVLDIQGTLKVNSITTDRLVKVAKVALGALDTGGGVLSWQNPEAGAIIVQRIIFDVTTKATVACTVDVGATPTSATTSSNNLMTGFDVGTAATTGDNITNKGASGQSFQRVAAGKWVTGSKASGAAAGLVGYAYIEYVTV